MTSLFIGRFQPLHIGHLDALKNISKKSDLIKIGIGSSNKEDGEKNPYSFDLRVKMIKKIQNLIDSKIEVFAISDINDDEKWVSHVDLIVGNYDLVFSGNDFVLNLFNKEQIKTNKIKFNIDICATKIREMIKTNKNFKKYLPKEIWDCFPELSLT